MEAYLINWLTNKIENYVHVNSHDVNLSLWQGRLSLRNLRLKPTRLDSLKVYLDWGWIESCSVLIDWSYIGTKPIKVEMNGVCLKVKRTRGNTDSPMTSSSDDNTKGLNLSYSFDIHDMKVEVDEMFNISVGHSLLFKSSANVTDGRCHWEIRFRSVSIQDRYNDVSMKLYAEMITCSMISGVSSEVYVANFAATCYHPVTGTETTFISSHNKNGWMFLLTAKFVEGRLSSFRACTQGDIHVRLNGPILNSILTIYQRSTTSIVRKWDSYNTPCVATSRNCVSMFLPKKHYTEIDTKKPVSSSNIGCPKCSNIRRFLDQEYYNEVYFPQDTTFSSNPTSLR